MLIELVATDAGTELLRLPVPIEYVFSVPFAMASVMVGFLVWVYKYGVKVGELKGIEIGYKDGHKIGMSAGKSDFRKSTKVLDKISCPHNPLENLVFNGISIIKTNEGKTIDVECPFINDDKVCQKSTFRCEKLSS